MLIKVFRVCRLIRVSTDEVMLEGRGLRLSESCSIGASLCVFLAYSPPNLVTLFSHSGLLCHCIHLPLFLPLSLYSELLPASLVLFVFQSLIDP